MTREDIKVVVGAMDRANVPAEDIIRISDEMERMVKIFPMIYGCDEENAFFERGDEFPKIEKALGFKLFIWQKSIIDGRGERRTGKTTAEILQLLLGGVIGRKEIDISSIPPRHAYVVDMMIDIKKKLANAGIETLPIVNNRKGITIAK